MHVIKIDFLSLAVFGTIQDGEISTFESMLFQNVLFDGRWDFSKGFPRTSVPAARFAFSFKGSNISLEMEGLARWKVELDGSELPELKTGPRQIYHPTQILSKGTHRIVLTKKTETEIGCVSLHEISPKPLEAKLPRPKRPAFEFIGDSYTVGYGNTAANPFEGNAFETTDATQSYGAILSKMCGADFAINAYSGRGVVQNFGGIVPNWTIPKLYEWTLGSEVPNSPRWNFADFSPDIVFLFMGINDFQGKGPHPGAAQFDTAYLEFLNRLRSRYTGARYILLSTEIFPENLLPERIEAVVSKDHAQGNRDASHLFLETPDSSGLDFHPAIFRHKTLATRLFQKISHVLNPKILT